MGWGVTQIDKQWENNARQANNLNIPLFTYHFCYARNKDEAEKEAELALLACEEFDVCVIYYDMDYSAFQGSLSNNEYYEIAKAFCDKIESSGYAAGIYAKEYWFKTKLTDNGFSAWTLWIASFGRNDGYDNWQGNLKYNPFDHVLLHQFTSKAKNGVLMDIEGISSTFLDCSLDYGVLETFATNVNNKPSKVVNKVKVKQGAKWYDGQTIPEFVFQEIYSIIELRNDRVVIGLNDKITGAISIDDIYLV